MPLQNRVDPFGRIVADDSRGLFTGNRGIIHDPDTRTLLGRRWSTRSWIVCTCEWKGRRRKVMSYNRDDGGVGWTELFFLDEVTALSAGHRPCFYCRRDRAKAFMACFAETSSFAAPKVADIDRLLHAERLASGGSRRPLTESEIAHLPDGAMVASGDAAFAVRNGRLLRWSFKGYDVSMARAGLPDLPVMLLTPPTTAAILRDGYQPVWHDTAA